MGQGGKSQEFDASALTAVLATDRFVTDCARTQSQPRQSKCTARVAPEEQASNVRLPAVLSLIDVSTLGTDMAKTYAEKLRDPRWQRRRLEILNRSNFTCEACGADDQTLNVHHRLYRKGADPWDYADNELQALCEECHEALHSISDVLKSALAQLNAEEIEQVLGYVRGCVARRQIEPSDIDPAEPLKALSFELPSESYASGFLDALWIDYTHTEIGRFIAASPFSGSDLWALHFDHCVARMKRVRGASGT